MQWILKYWVVIVVAVVAIGAGVGLAMWSSNANKPSRVGTPTIGNNESIFDNAASNNAVYNTANTTNKKTGGATYSTPLPLLGNLMPWGMGPSDQTSSSTSGSTSTSLPSSQTPWGQGPSQQ